MGLLENLSGLTVYGKDDRPCAGHELKHFGWNHGLEDVISLQQDDTGIRSTDVGRNVHSGLLIDEPHVLEPARARVTGDPFLVGSLTNEQKKYVRGRGLQVLCGFEEGV